MNIVEQIRQKSSQLPEHLQREVLDYIEFVLAKRAEREQRQMDSAWSDFSLASAMRGMEDEDISDYETVKFVEKWK